MIFRVEGLIVYIPAGFGKVAKHRELGARAVPHGGGLTSLHPHSSMMAAIICDDWLSSKQGVSVAKSRANKKSVPAEAFIRAWQSSESMLQAAEKANMTINAVRQRCSLLRGRGVPLKEMPRKPSLGAPPLNIEALKKLAIECLE